MFACIWAYIGDKEGLLDDPKFPWMLKNWQYFKNLSQEEIYVFCLYYIYTIIATVGYGDFTAGTKLE